MRSPVFFYGSIFPPGSALLGCSQHVGDREVATAATWRGREEWLTFRVGALEDPRLLITPKRLTGWTWKWWFGRWSFPFPGVYSQVPAVNLPGCTLWLFLFISTTFNKPKPKKRTINCSSWYWFLQKSCLQRLNIVWIACIFKHIFCTQYFFVCFRMRHVFFHSWPILVSGRCGVGHGKSP